MRRHVVVNSILRAKARGHRAYISVDADKVHAKARSLPEDGVPPELTHLLPNDGALDKIQIQKAATPIEGLREDLGDTAHAFSVQRPNAVVL